MKKCPWINKQPQVFDWYLISSKQCHRGVLPEIIQGETENTDVNTKKQTRPSLAYTLIMPDCLRFSDETIGQKNLLTCVATFSPEDGKVPAYIKNISEMSNIWQKSISWDSKLETFLKGIADIDTKCVGVTVKNYLKIFVKSQVKYFVTISFLKCFPEVKLDPLCWTHSWKQFEKLMNEILPVTDYGLMLWWYIAVQHFPKC